MVLWHKSIPWFYFFHYIITLGLLFFLVVLKLTGNSFWKKPNPTYSLIYHKQLKNLQIPGKSVGLFKKPLPLSWKHWHSDFYHLRAGNPKVWPCFVWVVCWWASESSAAWAALQTLSGNPCRGPGHSLHLLGRRRAAPQRGDGGMVVAPSQGLLPLGRCEKPHLCFSTTHGKAPRAGWHHGTISTAWLCLSIQVRNAELLLIEKKQLTLLWPVCCQGGTLHAALPPVHLSLCSSVTASPHTHTDSSGWFWTHTLVCLMDHNSDIQFRT